MSPFVDILLAGKNIDLTLTYDFEDQGSEKMLNYLMVEKYLLLILIFETPFPIEALNYNTDWFPILDMKYFSVSLSTKYT